MTSEKVFLDTNILIQALDKTDRRKMKIARQLLREAAENNRGVISTQVLQEFYVAATKKLGIDPLSAKELLHQFQNLETIVVSQNLITEAIDCSILNRISFWDSLIVAAAESAECSTIWTEDLNDGQIIRGVQIKNPFK
jgi:predicted nucleic acid-binding protein